MLSLGDDITGLGDAVDPSLPFLSVLGMFLHMPRTRPMRLCITSHFVGALMRTCGRVLGSQSNTSRHIHNRGFWEVMVSWLWGRREGSGGKPHKLRRARWMRLWNVHAQFQWLRYFVSGAVWAEVAAGLANIHILTYESSQHFKQGWLPNWCFMVVDAPVLKSSTSWIS